MDGKFFFLIVLDAFPTALRGVSSCVFFLAANFGKQWSSVKAVMGRNSSSTGTCQGEKMANQPILNFGPTPMECQIKG